MNERRSDPRFRLDLIIATLALLASASASIATVVQTRVVANQLSAAVWPYLSFTTTTAPNSLLVTLDNDGLGPALVRTVYLTVDGRPQSRWRSVVALFRSTTRARAGKSRNETLAVTGFGGGTVIRPATNFAVLDFRSPGALRIAAFLQRRVSLKICYCSILQKCWRIAYGDDGPPVDVASCGTSVSNVEY
jgi:hypothetical protein